MVTFRTLHYQNKIRTTKDTHLAFGKRSLTFTSSASLSKVMRSTPYLAAYFTKDFCLQGLAQMMREVSTPNFMTWEISPWNEHQSLEKLRRMFHKKCNMDRYHPKANFKEMSIWNFNSTRLKHEMAESNLIFF